MNPKDHKILSFLDSLEFLYKDLHDDIKLLRCAYSRHVETLGLEKGDTVELTTDFSDGGNISFRELKKGQLGKIDDIDYHRYFDLESRCLSVYFDSSRHLFSLRPKDVRKM